MMKFLFLRTLIKFSHWLNIYQISVPCYNDPVPGNGVWWGREDRRGAKQKWIRHDPKPFNEVWSHLLKIICKPPKWNKIYFTITLHFRDIYTWEQNRYKWISDSTDLRITPCFLSQCSSSQVGPIFCLLTCNSAHCHSVLSICQIKK